MTELAAPTVVRVDRDAAVRAFCEAEYAGLARYAYRLVGNEHTARDIAQEACVRLFVRWSTVREPRAYAYVLATNLARREWRRVRDERQFLDEHRIEEPVVAAPDTGLRDAVERLPRKWRDIVVLYYLADLPLGEVARCVGQPEGTVKRRLSEARSLLAKALEGTR